MLNKTILINFNIHENDTLNLGDIFFEERSNHSFEFSKHERFMQHIFKEVVRQLYVSRFEKPYVQSIDSYSNKFEIHNCTNTERELIRYIALNIATRYKESKEFAIMQYDLKQSRKLEFRRECITSHTVSFVSNLLAAIRPMIYSKQYHASSLQEIENDVKQQYGHLTLLEQKRHINAIAARYLND